jgi:hypothetical protein
LFGDRETNDPGRYARKLLKLPQAEKLRYLEKDANPAKEKRSELGAPA